MNTWSQRLARSAGALLLGVLVTALASPGVAAPDRAEEQLLEWLDAKEQYYEANPELKTTKSSGYKPYMRHKWFIEQRMTDGRLWAPDARWRAWETKVEREQNQLDRATWFTLGPTNFAGRMLAIDFDPNDASTVYVGGADGGVWKSTNSGTTWTPMSDNIPSIAIGGLAVSKTNSNIVVIGTGEGTNNVDRVSGVGVLRSTDAGLNWEATDLSFAESAGHGFHQVEAGPNGTFLAGSTDGLWRSTDDGATWLKVRDSDDWFDMKWKPGSPNTVYAAKGEAASANGVKISTDDGATWSNASSGLPFAFQIGKIKIAVTPANPEVVYAIVNDTSGSPTLGIYKSTNSGTSWNAQNTTVNVGGGQGWYNLTIVVDPNDEARVIAGGVSLYRSTNSGVNLSVTGSNVHVDHHCIAYEPGSDTNVWVGSDGGMWRSTNDGVSWTDRNSGLVTYQFYDICVNNGADPYYIMGGTQDNGTDKWSGTTTWANGLGADGMVCNINPITGNVVYAEIQFGSHRKNTNRGSGSWSNINSGIFGDGLWVTPVDQDQNTPNHLFTSTSSGIFETTSGGSSWTNVDNVPAKWISISPVNSDYTWTVAGTPRYTTNQGNTWQYANAYGFSAGGATKILADPVELNTVYVVFSGYSSATAHIVKSTDLGVTWADISGDFPPQPVNAIAVNPVNNAQVFIGTDIGVWETTNGGVNWTPFGTGLPNVVIDDLEIKISLQKLVAGTHGRGAWEIDIPSTGTGVEVAVDPSDLNLMLDPPSPNPVRDRTLLRFAAKSGSRVTLDIYDVTGRLVSNVAELGSGDGVIRTAPWLTDDVPSGVYFAVLRAGTLRQTQKIVVAR